MSKAVEVVPIPLHPIIQFHVYRLLIAPSIIDNLITDYDKVYINISIQMTLKLCWYCIEFKAAHERGAELGNASSWLDSVYSMYKTKKKRIL